MMTEALELERKHTVLEIGTGSGYQAAILSRICRRVYTIERHKELLDEAEARFGRLRLHNITTRLGDGSRGWPESRRFDRIIVTCAAEFPPQPLLDQLNDDGIMILPIGASGRVQELVRLRKRGGEVLRDDLGLVRFVPLVGESPEDGDQAGGRRSQK
jgi:protein-L-isoaspartate(D-aspartate) O-methyltransferase